MARVPYAADTLVDEVRELYPDVDVEVTDEPDGLGVHRTIKFDKDTSQEIAEAVEWLGDRRLHSVKMTDAGYLHVTFRPESVYADQRDPFMVKIALDVLRDGSADGD